MNVRTVLFGLFVLLTIVFASVTAEEFGTNKTTSTYSTTSTIVGTTNLTAFTSGKLYQVTFKEGSGCGSYIEAWGVQLGNLTITEPSNLQLNQISEGSYNASGTFNLTTIAFSVPAGTYPFTLYPTAFLTPPTNNTAVADVRGSGWTVSVTSSDVTIETSAAGIGCYVGA